MRSAQRSKAAAADVVGCGAGVVELGARLLIANGDGQYTVHGLRKNAGIMLAENGATVPMIMAALGHKSPKLALYYTRLADQAKLSDQASEIINMVFNRRAAAKDAKANARRAQIREVKNDD